MVEAIRAVADWLAGTTLDYASASQSVNTKLAAMTFDGADTAPSNVTVSDATRSPTAARRETPDTLPAVIVSLAGMSLDHAVMSYEKLGEVRILVRLAAENIETDDGLRDHLYRLRAVAKSLHQFHLAANNTARTRNNFHFVPSARTPMEMVIPETPREDTAITTGWQVTYEVRELSP